MSLVADSDQNPIPGFPSFCGHLFPEKPASKYEYLPLVPKSPTSPSVLKDAMLNLVATSRVLGDEWTIITGDQATYELARAIRDKEKDQFQNVILLLGGFHQAHNFLHAVCKIMRSSGVEELVSGAGLCSEGTAKKILGERGEYYQSLHAIQILNEAMWRLYWEAFEIWLPESSAMRKSVEDLINIVHDNELPGSEQLGITRDAAPRLRLIQDKLQEFDSTLTQGNAKFWRTFLEMTDILLRFLFYQREGHWEGHLSESANMLPFLTAAGHFKYGQESLPLYIKEMKQLEAKAPGMYSALSQGCFVARRSAGSHNAVSPDMLLEQTYNADAKEESGLDGITDNPAARTKWVLTKPVTAAASAELKNMLGSSSSNASAPHESGPACVMRDIKFVENVMALVKKNPFSEMGSSVLMNVVDGTHADTKVQHDLTNIKEAEQKKLDETIGTVLPKTSKMALHTFHSQTSQKKKQKQPSPANSSECNALQRITQLLASGQEVDVVDMIGNYECSKYPPAIFAEDGSMRSQGTKSTLVNVLKETSNVQASTAEDALVSGRVHKTGVIVDAMFAIRGWSFHKDELFLSVADRYLRNLLFDCPKGTDSIHFCCDYYAEDSLKSSERLSRAGAAKGKAVEVDSHFKAPDPSTFFSVSSNKSSLQNYLCETFVKRLTSSQQSLLGNRKLYLGGGFDDVEKTVLLKSGKVSEVPQLASTQEEADTRMILHAAHCLNVDGCDRLVVHANDTDVIVLFLYFLSCSSEFEKCKELWIRTEFDCYLPIHELAENLGPSVCKALPFVHSMSGRDTTSYPYFYGKRSWFAASKNIDLPALSEYGEGSSPVITQDVIDEARSLMLMVYGKSANTDIVDNLKDLRAHKFLHNTAPILKMLPPTEGAFLQHLRRSALATYIDKHATDAKPDLPPSEDYGWSKGEDGYQPVTTDQPVWPEKIPASFSCNCRKGCNSNCSCDQKKVDCYIGCFCMGSVKTCKKGKS